MISANELRIGNYLLITGESISISSGFIADYDFSVKNNFSSNTPLIKDSIEPIPITEEWLLKFGFEYFESNDSYQLDTDLGFCIWGRIHYGFYIFANSEELGSEIRYVHELQNLYFALTKKELELK